MAMYKIRQYGPPYQVGGTYIKNGKTNREKLVAYKDVPRNKAGWADAKLYYPLAYDMVKIHLERGEVIKGWHTGKMWDGYRLKDDDEVLHWKECRQS